MTDILLLHIKRNKLLAQQQMNKACTKEATQTPHKYRYEDYPKRCERLTDRTNAAVKKIDNQLKQYTLG